MNNEEIEKAKAALLIKSRPKWFSKRHNLLRKYAWHLGITTGKCDRCGLFLPNPQSAILHNGRICENYKNKKLMETAVENQLSIIEKSLLVFQQAGTILKTNQEKTTKALIVGTSILEQWKGAWAIEDKEEMFAALRIVDERSNTYLVNCGTALKFEKEARAVVTQIMDEMKKMFTTCENDIDRTKPNTVPSKIQNHRDTMAELVAKEEKRKREEAALIAAKQKEAAEISAKVSIGLNNHFENYLLENKQKLTAGLNNATMFTITEVQLKLKGYQPEYKREHFEAFMFHCNNVYQTLDDLKLLVNAVKNDALFQQFNFRYKSEMGTLAQELIDKIPSKRNELIEADERQKAADTAAEKARLQEEERQAQMARARQEEEARKAAMERANADDRAKLEEEARVAREANAKLAEEARLAREQEDRRQEQVRREQAVAAEEKRVREEAEAARLRQEAHAAQEKAEQDAEMKKQTEQTMIMFEQEAAVVRDGPAAEARQGYEVTVLHPAGYVEVFQFWFQNEGKGLPVDKIGNTKMDQMKAFIEKTSHKQGHPCIDSKFLKFEESFKAVNRKAAK